MSLNPEYLQIGANIIGAAFNVRKESGRGLREKYYEAALTWEISQLGHNAERQKLMPCLYKGHIIGDAYASDIIVDNKVIIEVKAKTKMTVDDISQLLTYMKLSGIKLGYLINFGARDFCTEKVSNQIFYEKGIYRLVNGI